MDKLSEELQHLILKIIVPALVAISIKLAVESKQGKISIFNAFSSIIIGVGCAWLSSGWVTDTFTDSTMPIVIGVITIAGEKVAFWLIYKFNFDIMGDAVLNIAVDWIKNVGKKITGK